jgi:hypothetical protein
MSVAISYLEGANTPGAGLEVSLRNSKNGLNIPIVLANYCLG